MVTMKSTLLCALLCFLAALQVQQIKAATIPKGKKTLLYNGMIVTMDPSSRVYKTGAVLIDGKIIAQIGQSAQLYKEHKNDKDVILINLQGKFVLPGFINTHVHTNLQLARGMGNDVILSEWLGNRLFPFESFMTEQDAYIGALATGVELIRSGVTTYAEAGGQHVPGIARATEELGLRAALTQSVLNFDRAVLTGGKRLPVNIIRTADEIISSQEEMYKKFNGAADGRLRMWLGIRQITTSTDELLNRTRDKAKELHTGIHMHVSALQTENAYVRESRGVANGSGTVTYLEKIKLLDTNLLASVAVWVNDQEIGYMAKAGVKVSHCPANSMYTFGFSPIQQMLNAGITVSLATDGPANNRMSIIDEMYAASLHTKGRAAFYTGVTDPTAVPAEAVLKMVTIDGAKSLLWDKEIGSIETLKKADLIIVDPFIWTMEPILDSIGALVYSMRSENIESVMCDGKWLMKDRKLLTVDEKKVLQLGRKTGLEILKRANISIPQRMNFV